MTCVQTVSESEKRETGESGSGLVQLQQRLERMQLARIIHGQRAILLLEGLAGSGSRAALKALAAAFDPCATRIHCHQVGSPDGRHWLAPYWSSLPRTGETAIFLHSWYGDAIDRAAQGQIRDRAWARACDEINEFEAQQTDDGTPVIKLFFHVSAEVQDQRLRARREDPWLRFLPDREAWSVEQRQTRLDAWDEMFKRTDTRWAKWTALASEDEATSTIAAFEAVIAALEPVTPKQPPPEALNQVDRGQPMPSDS